ncbi:glutaredoxin 3 [Rheinheimera sp. MMS21-TC3]|uniref:glutaredoxin 3 n=1 Tax=Rheinheimera sp. MMS21-TC3 TaxID=3072790 RepID=UPI0028C4744A|nr:glutaredoxin 3 [Rheinheimera sp. MMS21-TC3]WNO60390.1 glutaredoxin 3 [Rheinheimera sp. MMS21-TC3]
MAKVVMYSKAYCPYCMQAAMLLQNKGVAYEEIRIDLQPEKRAEMIEKANGRTTVPQIFINDFHVGGCDDLVALDAAGDLAPLLTN